MLGESHLGFGCCNKTELELFCGWASMEMGIHQIKALALVLLGEVALVVQKMMSWTGGIFEVPQVCC